KLLPALFNLHREHRLPERLVVLGVSRSPFDVEGFRKEARDAIQRHSRVQPASEAEWEGFSRMLECAWGAYDDGRLFEHLPAKRAELARTAGTGGNALFYLATPSSAFSPLLAGLARAGLLPRSGPGKEGPWARLVVEKPFGRDLASAEALNHSLAEVLDEKQI